MRVWLVLAVALVAADAAAQEGYTPPPPSVSGTFPSTCEDLARADVQSGVSLLFLLEPAEAQRSFERAVDADPDCAIAEWGRALALLGLPDAEPSVERKRRATAALARAGAARRTSARERAYLDAARRLVEPADVPYPSRLASFAKAATDVASAHRDDPHASLVAALAWLAASALPGDTAHARAARLITATGAASADPGAATLLVLARDNPRDAPEARDAARAVVEARPPSAMALHAAARIFHRLGDWPLAQRADEAALDVAGGIDAPALLDASRWHAHPLPWLVVADVEQGQHERARHRLAEARERTATRWAAMDPIETWRLRAIVDLAWLGIWHATLDWQGERPWPDPALAALDRMEVSRPSAATSSADVSLALEVTAQRAFVGGLLAARAAWPRGEPDRIQFARAAAAALAMVVRQRPVPPRLELMRTLLLAAIAAALEARDELALLEKQAAALESTVTEAGEEWRLPLTTPSLMGELRLQLRDAPEALAAFAAAAAARPGRSATVRGAERAKRMLARR